MEGLLLQVPEVAILIAEELDDADARSFGLLCREADAITNYVFKNKCMSIGGSEYRGWKHLDVDHPDTRWGKLLKEMELVRKSLMLAWSFHEYTNDSCERVYDSSSYKCHGNRVLTKVVDGQFGKALHLPPSEVKGAQVLAILNSISGIVDTFTLAFWIRVELSDTVPILSLLFSQRAAESLNTHNPSLNFLLLNINAQGKLFFGRASSTSTKALESQAWYHLVLVSDARAIIVYASDAQGEYSEVLRMEHASAPRFDKMVVVVGNGKKGDFVVEEMSLMRCKLGKEAFSWLRNGLPFIV